jgi:hypothetical protein
MLGRAAAVLAVLVAQVPVVGGGVSQVARLHEVHDGLGGLPEGGDHAVDEEKDEHEAQAGIRLPRTPSGINAAPVNGP